MGGIYRGVNILSSQLTCWKQEKWSSLRISASLTRAMLPWLEDDRPRDACGEQSLDGVVQSNRQATVAQIAEKVNDGSARKVSEQMYYSWQAADRSGCP